MQLCVNGEPQDALTTVIHRSQAQARVGEYVTRFKKFLSYQLFEVAIQAKLITKWWQEKPSKQKEKT